MTTGPRDLTSEEQIIVELQESMGNDASIANAAWTSTYDKLRREEKYDDATKVAALVPRLIREGHSTPIESVVLRFWIRMPIFTDRQHMTHRIASHNGLSGRYRTMPMDFFKLPADVCAILDAASSRFDLKSGYETACSMATVWYMSTVGELKTALAESRITEKEYKRARELIRGALPTSGMVERTTIMNLRSFANYQRLRNSDHAQPEIRRVAHLMLEEVEKYNVAPIAIATLKEMGWRI